MLVAINNTDLWIRACFIKFFLPLFVRYHGGQTRQTICYIER